MSREIEFMNSQVNLQGFFVIDLAILFFDSRSIYAYYVETGDFRGMDIREVYQGEVTPARYFMRTLSGRRLP
jgi:hypothetical protein